VPGVRRVQHPCHAARGRRCAQLPARGPHHPPDLAAEILDAIRGADVCLVRGHGITVAAETVQAAVVRAVSLNARSS
jgi:ribulose-5-phosphate 4-epimerase/fuculose-1-phosphate aldolase